jgi:hypothetical protein
MKKAAEICPNCGVRNRESGRGSASGRAVRNYETTVSHNWWYGVLAATALWVVVFGLGSAIGRTALMEWAVVAAWFLLPVSVYFDTKQVKMRSAWRPNLFAYLGVAVFIPPLGALVGAFYLFRRHKVLGTP